MRVLKFKINTKRTKVRSNVKNVPKNLLKKMFNIVSKSIKPSKDEVSSNPRSRSAKLNILEKANEDYV